MEQYSTDIILKELKSTYELMQIAHQCSFEEQCEAQFRHHILYLFLIAVLPLNKDQALFY